MMTTISVLGAGAWGTAVAIHLSRQPGVKVRLWASDPKRAERLVNQRESADLLPGVELPETITITADPATAIADTQAWIVAVPTTYLRAAMSKFASFSNPDLKLVSLTKGIENHTFARPTEILRSVLGSENVAVLSGPSHAEEVARRLPTSVVVAAAAENLAAWFQELFGSDRLRVYTNLDIVGVEFAGALKNVLGIAAGICDGLGFGDNAKAALLTRGIVEMTRFGVAHGADAATFSGLAGIGDLITTCFSPHGRNRSVGERLGRGETVEAVRRGPKIAEGIFTALSVQERAQPIGLETPIMSSVYDVLYQGKPPLLAVQELLSRRMRGENTD